MDSAAANRADPRLPARAFVGEARFDGFFVEGMLPRDRATSCLPPGFALAEQPYGRPSPFHPLIFIFGRQSETVVRFGGTRWPTGFRYLEAVLMLPFVRRSGSSELHSYLPRIYAGDRWATWSGNVFYGYNKLIASLCWISDTLAVSTPRTGVALEAKVEGVSDWEPAGAAGAFATLKSFADLPVAGRRADGSIVTSWFDWDVSAASLRSVRAAVSLSASVAPGLEACECNGIEGRSFEVSDLRWRVSWPSGRGRRPDVRDRSDVPA
jgi:hypothetical protein